MKRILMGLVATVMLSDTVMAEDFFWHARRASAGTNHAMG